VRNLGFFLTFAGRNLGRHRRRTLITASALAVGLGVFLLVDSMLQGADGESERNLLRYEFGGARIARPEAAAEPNKLSLKHPLESPGRLVSAVRAAGWVATPRLAFEAELVAVGTEDPASRVVRALGVDLQTDAEVFPRQEIRLDGRWPAAGAAEVVLGRWLAEDLGLQPGSAAALTTRTREGSFQVIDVEVCGLMLSPDPLLNRGGVYLPLDVAQTQLGMEGRATEVSVRFEPGSDAAAGKAGLQALADREGLGVRVLSWKDLAGDFLALASSKQKGSSMMLFLVFVIAAVGVGNTLLMSFAERKTEIGMLRALGMSDRRLFWSFLTEAAGIGAVGSALGLVLGAVLVAWITLVGIDFGWLVRTTDIGYRIAGVMHGQWVPRSFVGAGLAGVLLAVLCAVGPTRRALKLPITEALRSE